MQIKTSVRYPLTSIRMAIIKNQKINIGKNMEKKFLDTIGENAN
jgi:hypothetical protein